MPLAAGDTGEVSLMPGRWFGTPADGSVVLCVVDWAAIRRGGSSRAPQWSLWMLVECTGAGCRSRRLARMPDYGGVEVAGQRSWSLRGRRICPNRSRRAGVEGVRLGARVELRWKRQSVVLAGWMRGYGEMRFFKGTAAMYGCC